MPIVPLKLIPTVNAEYTPALNEAGISSCGNIRFKAKLPQKLGGWDRFYPFAVNGTPRSLYAWEDLSDVDHLSVGTTSLLGVITAGSLSDITPQTKTTNFAPNFSTVSGSNVVTIVDSNIANVTVFDSVFFNTPVSIGGLILHGVYPIITIAGATSYTIVASSNATGTANNAGAVPVFDTTSGSAIVTVTLTAHGLSTDSVFTFPIATAAGGLTIAGTYPVLSIGSADTFTIAANSVATSTATVSMNTANVQLVYYINLGPAAAGTGFGIGAFGAGGFGSGVVPTSQTGTSITTTDWTQTNWGEILLSCPKNGGIYQWSPNGGFQNSGLVATAPIFNTGIFVAMPEQILVCYGSTAAAPGSTATTSSAEQQDPLVVRWSDILNFGEFTVSAITQAGSQRLTSGSRIVGGMQAPQQALIWTDLGVWVMQYLGPPYVFGFNEISSGCGLIGQHAAAVMRGVVYWMSTNSFFMLGSGGVQSIPCSVWDIVFQDLDEDHQDKCIAAANSSFDEIWFFYPSSSGGSGECDKFVKYNIDEGSWDYGAIPRSAWIDQSVLGNPIGAASTGLIYQHEVSPNADGQPLNWYFQTGYFVIAEGQSLAFVDWFFPDMKWQTVEGSTSATVLVTIYVTDYPNQTPRVYGPFSMNSAKEFVNTRLRGRMISVRFEGNDLNSFARLGNMRFRINQDGRR